MEQRQGADHGIRRYEAHGSVIERASGGGIAETHGLEVKEKRVKLMGNRLIVKLCVLGGETSSPQLPASEQGLGVIALRYR